MRWKKYSDEQLADAVKQSYCVSDRREPSARLRRAMLESGFVYECGECHITSWNGKKLNLEIDHKDGNPLNNKRDNLVFLCPNCHSQTETYCNRSPDKTKDKNGGEKPPKPELRQPKLPKPKVRKPRAIIPVEQRFWEKVDKSSDCWIWLATNAGVAGYGRFKYCGKLESAHRVAWILTNGDIPESVRVNHCCGNRLCVNPDHLYLK